MKNITNPNDQNHNRPSHADIMTANEVLASSLYLNSQSAVIEAFKSDSQKTTEQETIIMKNENTPTTTKEAILAFVSKQNADTLAALKATADGQSAAELTHSAKALQHTAAAHLIEDIAPKIEAVDGNERAKALLHLHDMLSTDDTFGAIPGIAVFACHNTQEEDMKAILNEYDETLLNCNSEEDAQALYLRTMDIVAAHPAEKELLEYSIMTKLCDAILTAAFPLVMKNLTHEEVNRYQIYVMSVSAKPWEIPLVLPLLELVDGTPKAVFPSDIATAETVDDIMKGLEAFKISYSLLPTMFNTLQMTHLLPLHRRRTILELQSTATFHDIPIDDTLQAKIDIVQKGVINRLVAYRASSMQFDVTGDRLEELMENEYGIASAGDKESADAMLNSMFSILSNLEGLEDGIANKLTGSIADCVIASLLAVIEDEGEVPPDATMVRVMLYYAIRFALAEGNLAFWGTESFKALMALCGV